uniref:DDE_Tnp_1_7 domain-containing protein n=1 Tax=Panagrellus redivivus TaxID=6233 RepID=A0A7E4W3H0_PANRE
MGANSPPIDVIDMDRGRGIRYDVSSKDMRLALCGITNMSDVIPVGDNPTDPRKRNTDQLASENCKPRKGTEWALLLVTHFLQRVTSAPRQTLIDQFATCKYYKRVPLP